MASASTAGCEARDRAVPVRSIKVTGGGVGERASPATPSYPASGPPFVRSSLTRDTSIDVVATRG